MFANVGGQVEIYCSVCHCSMGLVSKGEFRACLTEDGLWTEKCFDCDKTGRADGFPEFYELDSWECIVIDTRGFYWGQADGEKNKLFSHTHDMSARARGLSSSTYLNTFSSDSEKRSVEESGKPVWRKVKDCDGCGGSGKIGWSFESELDCPFCGGAGGHYEQFPTRVTYLDIPEWILQPKFSEESRVVYDGERSAEEILGRGSWEELEENERWIEFRRDRFGVGEDE
jgi:hypothetical protein